MFKRNPKKLNDQERAEIYDKNKKMAERTFKCYCRVSAR